MRTIAAYAREAWRHLTSSRHVRALEEEIRHARAESTRLRQENRALLNSILGIAGIPPIFTSSAEEPRSYLSPTPGPETPVTGPVSPFSSASNAAMAAVRPNKLLQVSAPLRRRSWHQINRTLEFAALREKKPQAADQA